LAQAIFEPNLFPYKYPNILKSSHSSYLPAYDEKKVCSETSAYKIQTPENYPKESIQHSEHGEEFEIKKTSCCFTSLSPIFLSHSFIFASFRSVKGKMQANEKCERLYASQTHPT
jgi:hypothetical protein